MRETMDRRIEDVEVKLVEFDAATWVAVKIENVNGGSVVSEVETLP